MKKLLIGFLAVGLIMGFAMTASAQPNIKASGQLYMYGSYADNVYATNGSSSSTVKANPHSNIANRMRMQFEIQIQEGLKLTTRFDALERAWGEQAVVAAPSPAGAVVGAGNNFYQGTTTTERNISFERAYVTFNALYGVFDVGYMQSRVWGTCAFCDDYDSDSGMQYTYMMGPWSFVANWFKRGGYTESVNGLMASGEGSRQTYTTARQAAFLPGADNDHDVYAIAGIYRWATGQAGLRFEIDRDATSGKAGQVGSTGLNVALAPFGYYAATNVETWSSTFYELAPYAQMKYGPFDFEGELRYVWGKTEYDSSTRLAGTPDSIDRTGWSLYLSGKYTAGAFYGGLEFAYITGDDPSTTNKNEAGQNGGGAWDPLLMFGNYWYSKYHGLGNPNVLNGVSGAASATNQYTNFNIHIQNEYEQNLILFKPFVGWKVNPQLEIVAQYAWLKAQQKPGLTGGPLQRFQGDSYGQEFDIYATYKIYNNLSYTVGFGYFWTGDYFKGSDSTTNIADNYLVMNALNLSF